jgi:hypothetical protein
MIASGRRASKSDRRVCPRTKGRVESQVFGPNACLTFIYSQPRQRLAEYRKVRTAQIGGQRSQGAAKRASWPSGSVLGPVQVAGQGRAVRYLAGESAGQCGPCRFGLPAIADQVGQLADGHIADPWPLRRWLGQVDGRGGCAHPDGAVRLVRSALRTFSAELERHAAGRCSCGPPGLLPVPSGSRR